MPSFNALAGAAMTPGGVTAGLSDLVGSLVNAPIKRRQIELAQAAELASQQQAQAEFAFRQQSQADDMGLARDKFNQDGSQFDTTNKRLALDAALDYDARMNGPGRTGAGNQFTFEDALREAGRKKVPNPAIATDPSAAFFNPEVPIPADQQLAMANQFLNAAPPAAAGGIMPVDRAGGGPSTDPFAAQARAALLEMGGLLAGQQAQAKDQSVAGERAHEVDMAKAKAPVADPVDEESAQVKAWLADPKYSDYTEQELREYYRTQAAQGQ